MNSRPRWTPITAKKIHKSAAILNGWEIKYPYTYVAPSLYQVGNREIARHTYKSTQTKCQKWQTLWFTDKEPAYVDSLQHPVFAMLSVCTVQRLKRRAFEGSPSRLQELNMSKQSNLWSWKKIIKTLKCKIYLYARTLERELITLHLNRLEKNNFQMNCFLLIKMNWIHKLQRLMNLDTESELRIG